MGSVRTAVHTALVLAAAATGIGWSAAARVDASGGPAASKPKAPVTLPPRISDLSSASGLLGVDCPSADDCVVAGASRGNEALVDEVVNTKAAKPVVVKQANSSFMAVGCQSPAFCLLGGQAEVPAEPSPVEEGVLAVYSHGAVHDVTLYRSTSKDTGPVTEFDGVACQSSTWCWAVGYGSSVSDGLTRYYGVLAEVKVDEAHSTFTAEVSSVAQTTDLRGVACPSASRCWVVGAGPKGAAEFQISKTTVEPPAGTVLSGAGGDLAVACSSATSCTTVGFVETSDSEEAYAETLSETGTGKVQLLPSFVSLFGVANLDPHHQLAVGDGQGFPVSDLITNGVAATTSDLASPGAFGHGRARPPGAAGAEANGPLYAVSCPETTYCLAVGTSQVGDAAEGDLLVLGFENVPGTPSLSLASKAATSIHLRIGVPADTGGVGIHGYDLVVEACKTHAATCSATSVRHIAFAKAGLEKVGGLKAGKTYRLQAFAVNSFGSGAGSPVVTTTTA